MQAAKAEKAKLISAQEAALFESKARAAEWKAKYDALKNEVALKLELKEAQVKNSMMAVAWTAHTSALQMRMGNSMGGIGSPGANATPPPPNPFANFL